MHCSRLHTYKNNKLVAWILDPGIHGQKTSSLVHHHVIAYIIISTWHTLATGPCWRHWGWVPPDKKTADIVSTTRLCHSRDWTQKFRTYSLKIPECRCQVPGPSRFFWSKNVPDSQMKKNRNNEAMRPMTHGNRKDVENVKKIVPLTLYETAEVFWS